MAMLPEKVSKAWENRKGPIIFATVDQEGRPNAIYAGCVSKFNEETLVVANNYFSKTLDNILAGSKGAILFMTEEGAAYQVKGSIEYHTEGAIFEDMKRWNSPQRPGHGAAALNVEEVYRGAERLL
jgi:hypothetical protein